MGALIGLLEGGLTSTKGEISKLREIHSGSLFNCPRHIGPIQILMQTIQNIGNEFLGVLLRTIHELKYEKRGNYMRSPFFNDFTKTNWVNLGVMVFIPH